MYVGWDIGIKNLAYCIIDNSNEEIQRLKQLYKNKNKKCTIM